MFKDGDIVFVFLRNRVLRFRQKIIRWRAGAIFMVCARKKMCIIRQPVNFFTKNDNSVKFSQKTTILWRILWRNLWNFCEIFYGNVELFLHVFLHLYGGEKTGMLKFLSCVHPLIRLFKKLFTKLNFHTCVPHWYSLIFHDFLLDFRCVRVFWRQMPVYTLLFCSKCGKR